MTTSPSNDPFHRGPGRENHQGGEAHQGGEGFFHHGQQPGPQPQQPGGQPGLSVLTPGRVVLYVIESGPRAGTPRPADVISVADGAAGAAGLLVKVRPDDYPQGAHPGITFFVDNVACDPTGAQPGTWHWPPRA